MEIVEFLHEGKIKTGLLLYRNKKFLVRLSTGGEHHISASQILLCSKVNGNPGDLSIIEGKRKEICDSINLEELWDVLKDEKRVSLEELFVLWFGKDEISEDEKAGMLKKLFSEENIYFKFSGKDFIINEEDKVKNLKHQKESEREWERRINNFIDSCTKGEDEWKKDEEIIKYMKDFAVKGKISTACKKIKEVLNKLGLGNEKICLNFLQTHGLIKEGENLTLLKYEIPVEFPLKLQKFQPVLVLHGREKINFLETISIDPEETHTFDDAITVLHCDDSSSHFLIHIADPSGISFPDNIWSELMREILKRGETIYMPDGKIDMLPSQILESLSLVQGEDRPAISIEVKLKKDGIEKFDIKRSIVRVSKNSTYGEIDNISDHPVIRSGNLIEEWRVMRGGFKMMRESLEIHLDENGEIMARKIEPTPSRIAVSEFMGIASYIIALYCAKNRVPAFFRQLALKKEGLEKEKLRDFKNPLAFYRVMGKIEKNLTCIQPGVHELAGYELYAWGTSPLRRAFDFINIIQISHFLLKERFPFQEEMEEFLERIEESKKRAEACENERYFYFLTKLIEEKMKNKKVKGIIVDLREKESIAYVSEICRFVSVSKKPDHFPEKELNLYLTVDRKRQKIRGIEV